MAYELGGVRFWGMQYHPEPALRDVAGYLQQSSRVFDMDERASRAAVVAWNPLDDNSNASEATRAAYALTSDILKAPRRRAELINWMRVLAKEEYAQAG